MSGYSAFSQSLTSQWVFCERIFLEWGALKVQWKDTAFLVAYCKANCGKWEAEWVTYWNRTGDESKTEVWILVQSRETKIGSKSIRSSAFLVSLKQPEINPVPTPHFSLSSGALTAENWNKSLGVISSFLVFLMSSRLFWNEKFQSQTTILLCPESSDTDRPALWDLTFPAGRTRMRIRWPSGKLRKGPGKRMGHPANDETSLLSGSNSKYLLEMQLWRSTPQSLDRQGSQRNRKFRWMPGVLYFPSAARIFQILTIPFGWSSGEYTSDTIAVATLIFPLLKPPRILDSTK